MNKKRLLKPVLSLLLLIALLPLVLTGCKTFEENLDFTSGKFGENLSRYEGLDVKKLDKVKADMNVLDAFTIMKSNYDKYDYVASRGLVEGVTTGGFGKLDQKVYTTTIKEKQEVYHNSFKVYHEDAAVNSKGAGQQVVRIMQNLEFEPENKTIKNSNTIVKFTHRPIDSVECSYPKVQENEFKREEFKDFDSYLKKYHQNLFGLVPFEVTAETVSNSTDKVVANGGFFDITLRFNKSTLQKATLERRNVIAVKSSNIVETSANDVKFNDLTITIKVWKNGYIRSIVTHEDYNINSVGQHCKATSTIYYSNDPSELPISNFEFK